ncbi:MAG: proton-conducting transporter membrane subunit, partial [Thermodesulfobacteriota bacterium]
MDFSIFLPETFLLLTALIFFALTLWKASPDTIQGLAFFLTAVGLVISLFSINVSGEMFYRSYRVDLFSQIFKCLISLGFFLVVVLSHKLKSIEERLQPEFFMFLSLSALGLMLLVSSVELLTIFISMELSSYSIYVLIPVRNQAGGNPMEAAIKYIIFGAAATGVMIFGMSYVFGVSQS